MQTPELNPQEARAAIWWKAILTHYLLQHLRRTLTTLTHKNAARSNKVEIEVLERRRKIKDEERNQLEVVKAVEDMIAHIHNETVLTIETKLGNFLSDPNTDKIKMYTEFFHGASGEELMRIGQSLDIAFSSVDYKWMDTLLQILQRTSILGEQPTGELQSWIRLKNFIWYSIFETATYLYSSDSVSQRTQLLLQCAMAFSTQPLSSWSASGGTLKNSVAILPTAMECNYPAIIARALAAPTEPGEQILGL